MPEYSFEITPAGIRMDANGFRGGECLKELDDIRQMLENLGIETTVTDQDLKREAMLASGRSTTQTNRGMKQ